MDKVIAKTKTRQQIAEEYGITPRTLRRWIKKNNINLPKRLICPQEQKKIYEAFGPPVVKLPQKQKKT